MTMNEKTRLQKELEEIKQQYYDFLRRELYYEGSFFKSVSGKKEYWGFDFLAAYFFPSKRNPKKINVWKIRKSVDKLISAVDTIPLEELESVLANGDLEPNLPNSGELIIGVVSFAVDLLKYKKEIRVLETQLSKH